jgi:hypothetical protein
MTKEASFYNTVLYQRMQLNLKVHHDKDKRNAIHSKETCVILATKIRHSKFVRSKNAKKVKA